MIIGDDFLDLIKYRAEYIDVFRIYEGTPPIDTRVIPDVTKIIVDPTLSTVPDTNALTRTAVFENTSYKAFNKFFNEGYDYYTIIDSDFTISHTSYHEKYIQDYPKLTETLLINVPEGFTGRISDIGFSFDGLQFYVYTSIGRIVQSNLDLGPVPAKLHVYELTTPFHFTAAKLFATEDISSGVDMTVGLTSPTSFSWDGSGRFLFIASNGVIGTFKTQYPFDLRYQEYTGSVNNFDMSLYGGCEAIAFYNDGNNLLVIQGGYKRNTDNTIKLDEVTGDPIWETPILKNFVLSRRHDPTSLVLANSSTEMDLTPYFIQYQNQDVKPTHFTIVVDEVEGIMMISGVTGNETSKTISFDVPYTFGSNYNSTLITDLSESFKESTIDGNNLNIHNQSGYIEFKWERPVDELIKLLPVVDGTMEFFALRTKGKYGTLTFQGTVGEYGSGADLELNRVNVRTKDQTSLLSFSLKFPSVISVME